MPKTQCLFNLFLEPEAKTYSPCVRVITASKKVVKVLSEFLLGSHVNLMLQHAELSLSLTKIPNLFLLIYEISLFSLLVTSTIIHQKIILKLCFYSSVSVHVLNTFWTLQSKPWQYLLSTLNIKKYQAGYTTTSLWKNTILYQKPN